MPITSEELILLINSSFSSEKLPLTVSDGCSRDICVSIEDRFRGLDRKFLTPEDIQFLSINLGLLNSDAFRYYSSAIIIAALHAKSNVDIEALIQNFFYFPGINDYQDYNKNRLSLFEPQESTAILQLILFWMRDPDIDQAWIPYLQKSIPFWENQAKHMKK